MISGFINPVTKGKRMCLDKKTGSTSRKPRFKQVQILITDYKYLITESCSNYL